MLSDEYGEYARKVRPQRKPNQTTIKKNNGRLLAFGCFLHGYQLKAKAKQALLV